MQEPDSRSSETGGKDEASHPLPSKPKSQTCCLTAAIVIGAILAMVFFVMVFLFRGLGGTGGAGFRLNTEIPSPDGKYVAGYVRWTTDAMVTSEVGDTQIYVRRSDTPFALDKNGNVLSGQQTAYSYGDNHAYDLKVAWTGKHTLHIWSEGCDNEKHSTAAGELQWEEVTIRFRNCEPTADSRAANLTRTYGNPECRAVQSRPTLFPVIPA